MALDTIEVDIEPQGAIDIMDMIEKRKEFVTLTTERALPECRTFAINADGCDMATFVRLYVDGTWKASTHVALGEKDEGCDGN